MADQVGLDFRLRVRGRVRVRVGVGVGVGVGVWVCAQYMQSNITFPLMYRYF